jgi:hypothetical protein
MQKQGAVFVDVLCCMSLVKLSNTFGFFPECYGCKAYLPAVPKLLL